MLVYEIDDDIFSVLPENRLAWADYQDPSVRAATVRCLEISDLVTVSTAHLADVMRQYSSNVAVLPNCIPGWVTDLPRVLPERPCIGWAGGQSHDRDVALLAGPVRRFLKRFPGWDLHLAGTDYRPLFRAGRSMFIPWVPVWEQPEAYFSALDFSIGLAPLLDNEFNRSKSPLRALEYAARGIPVIASDVLPYREFVQDGVTGFLVRHEHEWLKRMSELACDAGLREQMGEAARLQARQHTIEGNWGLWDEAYGAIS
jgi:glycosyltransferase involved in cell wall biosynthesis